MRRGHGLHDFIKASCIFKKICCVSKTYLYALGIQEMRRKRRESGLHSTKAQGGPLHLSNSSILI
jgi:hypothetical protein